MDPHLFLHSTTVSLNGRAAVFVGASGSGKSTIALRMLSLGAVLVSDDQTHLKVSGGEIIASVAPNIAGKLEIRGLGIIDTSYEPSAVVSFFVDMDTVEEVRLPPRRTFEILGQKATLYHRLNGGHFADALIQILRNGKPV